MQTRMNGKTLIVDTLYFIVGSILYALSIYTFALHAEFAPGGVSGLAIIINYLTKLPVGMISLVLNIPLVLISMRVVGRSFILKSIWTMLITTVFVDVVFPLFPMYMGDRMIAAMFTGVTMGLGLALIYMRGSSSGGSDFIVLTVKKLKPYLSVGRISLVADGVVILLGGFVFRDVDAVLYGIISTFACTIMLDSVLYGAGGGKLAIIISDFGDEIAQAVSAEVGRGSTLVKATGTYTGEEREMLYCACSKNEIHRVRNAAHAVDPHALVMITEISEVIGEGFVPPPIPGNPPPPPPRPQPEREEEPPPSGGTSAPPGQ